LAIKMTGNEDDRMRGAITIASILLLGACMNPASSEKSEADAKAASTSAAPKEDSLAAHDPAMGVAIDPTLADDQPRPLMQMQVVLDRLGFTPGVVDGREGLSTRNALSGFQEANGLPVTGLADAPTNQALVRWSNIPATRVVTIPADFAAQPFQPIPKAAADQAKLQRLGYSTLDEQLAERFHTTIDTLRMLNPGEGSASLSSGAATEPAATASASAARPLFRAGQKIRVPNVGADRIEDGTVDDAAWRTTLESLGVGSSQPKATKIVVSKAKGTLRVYDAAEKLIGTYTATMGSRHDPLPLGSWKVTGVAHNPPFTYNPELFWDVPDSHAKQLLPPGPNGPVGVVWIDLSKEHYGIHGTPEPQTIGRAESHGCVRLTNWDAARLAQMVSGDTQVVFEA
jgi:lipoprotein-anchoring transpeptidase ErfK/SrfK